MDVEKTWESEFGGHRRGLYENGYRWQDQDNDTDTACNLCPPNSDESYERTMNLKKALKKTKAALRDLETTGLKTNKESQKKSVVECLENVEEIDTRK